MKTQNFAKALIMLIAGAFLMSCSKEKMKEIMTFEMSGDCMVYGPWEDPIPSKGVSAIQVLRPTKSAEKGYLQVYDFQWNTDFSYKGDSIFFSTPYQVQENAYEKQGYSANGWICGEDMYIQYESWVEGVEGAINCEVFGKKTNNANNESSVD